MAQQFMVIETFRSGCLEKAYGRFESKGRMLPDGLIYIDSWLEDSGARCFQLMETSDPSLFQQWIRNWQDLVEFEIIPIGGKPSTSSLPRS